MHLANTSDFEKEGYTIRSKYSSHLKSPVPFSRITIELFM